MSKNGHSGVANTQIVSIGVNRTKVDKTTFVIEYSNTKKCTYQVHRNDGIDKCFYASRYKYASKDYCIVQLDEHQDMIRQS
ncbi:MAG: hypothetical protein FWD76_01650 [Firmicutes bacterium]|nr:hypothetical protein [Bacillota bacterium]